MARFPSVPGAGPKRIGNPVYWSRMVIQNERYKQTSQNATDAWHEKYNLLFHWYDVIWEDELEQVKDFFNENEHEKFGCLNEAFKEMDNEIEENPHLDNSQLNKLKTRLKNLILFILKMCSKYQVYSDFESVKFDNNIKAFIINHDYDEPIYHLW
tara:strand:+ start:214 stop:678 length:465 start_codon:yes stop_codon:yes gene_type:complete